MSTPAGWVRAHTAAACVAALLLASCMFAHTVALRLLLLVVGIVLAAIVVSQKQARGLPPVWIPFLLWAAWALASLAWSIEPERTLKEWRNEVFYSGAALWICFVGAQARNAARIFLPIAGAAAAVVCAIALYEFGRGWEHYVVGWHSGPGDHSSALLVLDAVRRDDGLVRRAGAMAALDPRLHRGARRAVLRERLHHPEPHDLAGIRSPVSPARLRCAPAREGKKDCEHHYGRGDCRVWRDPAQHPGRARHDDGDEIVRARHPPGAVAEGPRACPGAAGSPATASAAACCATRCSRSSARSTRCSGTRTISFWIALLQLGVPGLVLFATTAGCDSARGVAHAARRPTRRPRPAASRSWR